MLAQTLRLDLNLQHEFFSEPRNLEPVYFGALYAIMGGWSSLAARDRKARFRIMPILWTGLLSAVSSRSGPTTARTASPSPS